MPTMRTGSGCLRAALRVAGVLFVGLTAVSAAPESIATALVVSVDVSQSVDDTRFRLQMEGIAEALEVPSVVGAITGNPGARLRCRRSARAWSNGTAPMSSAVRGRSFWRPPVTAISRGPCGGNS